MSTTDYDLSDFAAIVGNNKSSNGFFDGNSAILWFLAFVLFGGGFWGGNQAAQNVGADVLFPWMNQAQTTWTGFSQVQQDLCAGFANAETAATARQMADMQQAFAMQTAMQQGFAMLASQIAQNSAASQLAMANQTAQMLAEHCADRQALNDGIRDIIAKLDNQDLYAERRENENLRAQINMLNLAASQTAQTAQIMAAIQDKTTTAGA